MLAKAASGLPKPDEVIGNHFSADDKLFHQVLTENKPLIIGNLSETIDFLGWGGTNEMQSWMGIPLKASSDVIGILTLDKIEQNAYDQEKADFAMIFANQAAIAIQHAQLYQTAKDAFDQLMILHKASQTITMASFNPEQTYEAIHAAANQLMPCEAFSISIKDDENQEIEAVYLIDKDGRSPSARIPIGEGLSGYIISTGEPLLIHDFLDNEAPDKLNVKHFGNPDHIRAFIAVPMKLGEQVVGMLSAQSYLPHKYSHQDQQMLEMLAAHAAIAIDNSRLFAKVQHLAITDGLTNCHNRRSFFELAKKEFFRASRYQHPLSIIMVDLDYYKAINDTYGHLVGDTVLKTISQLLKNCIRETDTLGRYGGDEFSILLPETDLKQTLEIAERIKDLINKTVIEIDQNQISTTLSVGISSINKVTTDFSQLLLTADMALYDAKNGGRNRICSREWPIEKISGMPNNNGAVNG